MKTSHPLRYLPPFTISDAEETLNRCAELHPLPRWRTRIPDAGGMPDSLGDSFSERPAFSVSGDTEPVVNWLFDESSLDGKFKASEMIAKWNDKGWITRADNDHPLSYMAAAMRNLCTLINHHIGNAPKVELVKRGNKTLVIPEGTPESQLGILINKFTKR